MNYHSDSGPVLCIIHPNRSVYSETFIHAHIERLPARIKVLYGGHFPTHTDESKPLISSGMVHRIARALLRRVFSLPSEHFQKEALIRFLRKNRVDVVLAEYGQTGVAVLDACLETSIPLVVHFHGFDAFDQRVVDEFGKQYPRLFKNSSSIVAASRFMRDRLVELGASTQKIYVNPYGVDISLFGGAKPASAPPTLVAVGRFVDKKAPHLTLLSFKKVLEHCRDAQLIMVGDGELSEACKQIANALGISSSVQFKGVCSPAEIASILRNARAFVQHSIRASYGDSESLGVVFLEAGASGLPVIATWHDGIPEVVIDGKTGFLVEEGNIEEMAERMIRLVKDPDLAAQFGKAAMERISTEFYMEKSITNLWRILEASVRS
jgi:glycosyltransferase involved in cell wall biosynthesis